MLFGPFSLSKVIPEHKKTVKYTWCKKDWMLMSQQYRKVREKMRDPMQTCSWCKYEFKDGDMMALAHPENSLNKLLCQSCVESIDKAAQSATGAKDE